MTYTFIVPRGLCTEKKSREENEEFFHDCVKKMSVEEIIKIRGNEKIKEKYIDLFSSLTDFWIFG